MQFLCLPISLEGNQMPEIVSVYQEQETKDPCDTWLAWRTCPLRKTMIILWHWLREKFHNLHLENWIAIFCKNLNPLHPGCFVSCFFQICPLVLEKNILTITIFTISLFSPLRNGRGPLFEQTWLPLTQGCFVPSLVELAHWFWRRRFSLIPPAQVS